MSFLVEAAARAEQKEADDHVPIIRMLADHRTAKGGWQEWAAGCICGFYERGIPGKWYIPGEASALRIYNSHLPVAPEEDEPPRIEQFREMNDRVFGPGNWIECSLCPDGEGNPSYHHKDHHV